MRDLESREVKEELIEMDLDNEDVVREYMMDADTTPIHSPQANPSNMQQIVSAPAPNDDDTWDAKIDPMYMMLLDSFREDARDNPLRCIRYDVDNGCYDKREFKPVTNATPPRSREVRNNTCVNKKNLVETKPPVRASTKKRTEREAAVLRRRANVEAMHAKRKKVTSDEQVVLDEMYKAYLIRLVENSKSSRTNPQKEIQVKREKEDNTMSLSDDTEIIAVGDRPFQDEEDSPFVASKNYEIVDLEEECYVVSDQRNSWFRKEMTNLLKQPYNEAEYLELNREASMCKRVSRCWQLRDGREVDYVTKIKRPSYLDEYPDFKQMLSDALFEKDRHRALNLLRGFTFYLEKVARNDAFKPWLDTECLDITYGRKNSRSPRAIKSEFCTSHQPSFYGR